MEGIGLSNILGAEEVEKLFSAEPGEATEVVETKKEDNGSSAEEPSKETENTIEADFSDLFGEQPESVGSGEESEGREVPESTESTGAPNNPNLFSSIAKALRDEGVFPDLSDDTLNNIKDAGSFRKLFDEQVANSLSERQKRIEEAINGGANREEVSGYQNDLQISEFLDARETAERLESETEEGETLRKQVMYQDYINRGFSQDRAKKLVMKSIDDGTDIDDAKEALASCKEFYNQRISSYQNAIANRRKSIQEEEEKQYNALKKQIVDTEDFFGGVKVDKNIRQKAYDSLTKPVFKDDNGNYLTEMQRYQRENPMEFMKNVALMYSLTNGFKNVDNLTRSKVKAGVRKGLAALEDAFSNTRRNSDGTLNFANGEPSMSERDNWELAI